MNSNEPLRKTFAKFSHSAFETPQKKKTVRLVKLPSVKMKAPETGDYIFGDLIG